MAIVTYQNKSSVLKRRSRYVQGGDTIVRKKRLGWWERYPNIEPDYITDVPVYLDPSLAGRADLIAEKIYGDSSLEWIVLQFNNIVDTIEELAVGKTITIPSKDRVFFSILVHNIKI